MNSAERKGLRLKGNVPTLRFPEFWGEWNVKRLGDDCEIQMCKRIFANQTNVDGDVPFYKIGTIGGKADSFISKKLYQEYKERYNYPKQGEVMITCAGTVGKTIIYDGEDAYFQDSNIVWISNPKQFYTNDFLSLLLSRIDWSKLNATTIVRIYNDNLRELKIIFPAKEEQDKISSLLNLIDNRIVAQNRIINELQSLIIGLEQTLLKPQSNWTSCFIGDVLSIGSGRDYKHLSEGDIPVYGTGGYMLSVNDFLYDGESVCIGRKGTIDKPLYLHCKFWTVDTLFYTYDFRQILPRYCYYLFNTINWLKYNEASGVPSLSKDTIERIKISIPSIEEQKRVCDIIDSVDEKLSLEITFRGKLISLKQFLLSSLFV